MINTLLLYPSLSPYGQTDRQTDGETNQVVLLYCVSFWFWQEIGSFFVVAGNFHYDQKKKDTVVCLTGAQSITTGKKKDAVVCLLGARFWRLRPEKKIYSRLSGGLCCMLYQFLVLVGNWQFFVVAGNFYHDRKKKIQSSVWRVRDQLRPEKRYSRLSVGCAVLAITTRKKKDTVICLAGCAVVFCQFLVLAGKWQFFCCSRPSGGLCYVTNLY